MSTPPEVDVAIVGCGAAGLACAIFAAQAAPHLKITLLDGSSKIGAKILVSGGGRCNVTHTQVSAGDYSPASPFVRNVLRSFDHEATVQWMRSLGVELKCESTGKLFPVTDRASTVLEALLARCRALGVQLLAEHRVQRVSVSQEPQPVFLLEHSRGLLRARHLILATGGRSLPRTGSDGQGYSLAQSLGHSVTATHPALVPLVLDDRFFHAAATGIAQEVELSTFVAGKRIDHRRGSLLWTHFGVSGPVVMDASRFWVIAHAQGLSPLLRCNHFPGEDFASVERRLLEYARGHSRSTAESCLTQWMPQRLARCLMEHTGLEPSTLMNQLSREQRRALVHALTDLELPVVRDRGWNYAEVTAGGVPLEEVDWRTMQSRLKPGLFLAGEILACDGRIGGFNFQWAWATGFLAGKAAAEGLPGPSAGSASQRAPEPVRLPSATAADPTTSPPGPSPSPQ